MRPRSPATDPLRPVVAGEDEERTRSGRGGGHKVEDVVIERLRWSRMSGEASEVRGLVHGRNVMVYGSLTLWLGRASSGIGVVFVNLGVSELGDFV